MFHFTFGCLNTTCPLNGECCRKPLVYKAELTCDNITKYYYGLRETTFKTRYNKPKHTFRHQDKRHSTELSKAFWNAIETGKDPNVKWNIEKRAQSYQNGSNRCNLRLEEKITILRAKPANTLNQRTELVSKCRHKAKHKLRNHQPN